MAPDTPSLHLRPGGRFATTMGFKAGWGAAFDQLEALFVSA